MRLWHYELIPYLPDSQLKGLWRELNSIYKDQPNHILINYLYLNDYDKLELKLYSLRVIEEYAIRGFSIRQWLHYDRYFADIFDNAYVNDMIPRYNLFAKHHNKRYLRQCFFNLQEKYDRGQFDFTDKCYQTLCYYLIEEYPDDIYKTII